MPLKIAYIKPTTLPYYTIYNSYKPLILLLVVCLGILGTLYFMVKFIHKDSEIVAQSTPCSTVLIEE